MIPSITDGLFTEAIILALMFSLVLLSSSLVVGFIISVLQAATQIQEQTLTFVPKLACVYAILYFLGQWGFVELSNLLLRVFDLTARV